MSDGLTVRPMSLQDLRLATDWAAAEGWNPGLGDAETFHAIDPGGFLMGWAGDRPATAISVVAHSDSFGFLGFYLCDPALRGRGYGLATWQAGLARLGDRTVGLDGVPAQEANYRTSGFAFAFRSHRFEGRVEGKTHQGFTRAEPDDTEDLVALDSAVHGVERPAYIGAWVRQTATRQTLVLRDGPKIVAMGTIRQCRRGHKIGPVIAPDLKTATDLVESLVAAADASQIAIDIPETSDTGQALSSTFGLTSSFACARMYKGDAPAIDTGRLVGLTTFELG